MAHGDLTPPGGPPDGGLARLRDGWSGLGLSPAETAALALLAAGAVTALGLLWWLARPTAEAPSGGTLALASPGTTVAPNPRLTPAPAGPAGSSSGTSGSPAPGAAPSAAPPSEVVVHVAGLVVRPGVYRLPAGGRVADAVTAAGGALPEATPEGLNLARAVVDGEQVVVPGPGVPTVPPPAAAGPEPSAGPGAPAPGGAVRPDGVLDLNLATAEDLDELPGVGEVLAERILAHREQIGRFSEVGELRDVSGIGEKTFQELAPLVAV